ncbi:MAG: hypothetical protein OES09_06485 [Gammaproteobacteria bacterium]|nr:hypothetical protein [Gammaproteobacteria bacterium]
MFVIRHSTLKSALFLSLTCLVSAYAQAKEEFSRANQILFDTDHLESISEPTTLHYSFKKTAADGSGFNDTIDVRITRVKEDGSKDVRLEYFTGDRRRYAPEVPSALGNPVVVLYLQHDVNEMNRLTSGSWRHFQRRIKLALEGTDDVSPVRLNFQGREIGGREVRIEPYRDDPQNSQYTGYAQKYYVFTLAPEVPGYIFEIKSVVPGQSGGGPLVEEVLSYTGSSGVN